ncbi:hypothetical protein Lnau_3118 [Legionella nautarum]|uniref:Outer membrane protein beta-barrel domain-containing protein n=1 Tax=Legionella nautarum TaxID=45070 RepID=A0A0W0WIP5_9GAMM|nr:outer membrane beta-barrel protein [Legionella nautarum]KTD32207.1 hypothetical protein Lnau_3118 [Legionella nautarum]
MKYLVSILFFLSTTGSFACCEEDVSHWYLNGAFGYASYANHNGHTSLGRLGLGYLLPGVGYFQVGLEGGIQNGHTMRPYFPVASINALGGVPVELQLKPMLDLLAVVKTVPLDAIPVFGYLKAGALYQQLHIDRETVTPVKRFRGVTPELIVGLGYKLNDQASINISYQYFWGRAPQLVVNELTQTATLRNIPSRQAIMLGFSFNFL